MPVWQKDVLLIIPGRGDIDPEKFDIKELLTPPVEVIENKGKKKYFTSSKKKADKNVDVGKNKGAKRVEPVKPAIVPGRRTSWSTVNTLELLLPFIEKIGFLEVTSKDFKKMMEPLNIVDGDVVKFAMSFSDNLVEFVPLIKEDKTGRVYEKLKMFLSSPSCVRLYCLLCHFCYWNIIHPSARKALIEAKNANPDEFHEETNELGHSVYIVYISILTITTTKIA